MISSLMGWPSGSRSALSLTSGASAQRPTTMVATLGIMSPAIWPAAVDNFTFVEWDEVSTPGLDASAYSVRGR